MICSPRVCAGICYSLSCSLSGIKRSAKDSPMTDETKPTPPSAQPEPASKPDLSSPSETAAPAIPAEAKPAAKPLAAAPAKPAVPPKPAAPAVPKPVVKPEPWTSPLLDEIRKQFPSAVADAVIFRGMPTITLNPDQFLAVCRFLYIEAGGAYKLLTDETAVDFPKREKRFEVVYHLYSFQKNERLRLKVLAGEVDSVPSVVPVWPAANWMEREIFDLFGIKFDGHPNLKRILMPDDWTGHPLRKDYDIRKQDEAWVQANIHIESGQ